MSITKNILLKSKMVELGIIPACTDLELSKMLQSISESEQRKTKRKFRKLWKKLLKKNPDMANLLIPEDGKLPRRKHIRNRKSFVTIEIAKKLI